MYYGRLRSHPDGQKISKSLLSLKAGMSGIPAKQASNLLLATWNIREFGGSKYGGRTDEALYCIAEIISRFDLIAVQEVRADLEALDKVMSLLGRDWDRIFTDISYADSGGGERFAFLWDRRKVRFTGLAGELVLPSKMAAQEFAQVSRTPFICGFQAGWAKINLCTVHMYWGDGKRNEPKKLKEIAAVSELLAKKAKDYIRLDKKLAKSYTPENLVLLGDFNIFSREDESFKLMANNGFVVPASLMKDEIPGSNASKDKFYDQIAFYKQVRDMENTAAGIFDFFDHVFTEEDEERFAKANDYKGTFKNWRTYQMSDHLVMWTEFKVDKSDVYLSEIAQGS